MKSCATRDHQQVLAMSTEFQKHNYIYVMLKSALTSKYQFSFVFLQLCLVLPHTVLL
jgi:hypothetical protein